MTSPVSDITMSATLLLSPASLSSNPTHLENLLKTKYDRSFTDIQMLDRVALSLAPLPHQKYTTVVILSDPNLPPNAQEKIGQAVYEKIFETLIPGGKLISDLYNFGKEGSSSRLELILAGFVAEEEAVGGGVILRKPAAAPVAISLLRRKKDAAAPLTNGKQTAGTAINGPNGTSPAASAAPVASTNPTAIRGVGFIDFSDDLGDDDELIDEDTLLDDSDLVTSVQQRKF